VTAKLECDECVSFPPVDGTFRFEYDVRSNTTVRVSADASPAHRVERDLENRLLKTRDTLPSFLELEFIERPRCTDGSPMEVKALGDNVFCVAPHRGGFMVVGRVSFGEATFCHDAGCYTSTVTVTIAALPSVDCR